MDLKYIMPRVYKNLLDGTKKLYDDAIDVMNKKKIVTRSNTSMIFREILKTLFSKAGNLSLSNKMAIKDSSPRPYPSSSHYNKFVNALDTDIRSTFSQTTDMENAIKSYSNYTEAYKLTYNNLVTLISGLVEDIGMISTKGDSKKFHNFKDNFEQGTTTGASTDNTIVDTIATNLTLSPSETDDVLRIDNIEDVAYLISMDGKKSDTTYYGKKYATLDGKSDDAMRVEVRGSNWTGDSIVNIFDIDGEGSSTFWEAEIVQRLDTLSTTSRKYTGPWSVLVDPTNVHMKNEDGHTISYDYGHMVYQLPYQSMDFFYDSNGEAIQHIMAANITTKLKKPSTISSITLTRKPAMEDDIRGVKHEVYVRNIKTWDGNTWSPIQQFSTDYNYLASPNTTTTNTNVSSRSTSSILQEMISKDGITSSNLISTINAAKQQSLNNTGNKISSIPTASKSSVWTFPTRTGVLGVMFDLYTDYPYPIRYTMTQHKVATRTKLWVIGLGKVWSWLFFQHNADTSAPIPIVEDKSTWDKVKDAAGNSVKPIVSGRVVGIVSPIIGSLIGFYGALKGLATLFGVDKDDIDTSIEPSRMHNVDPIVSDMFRWSIEISDVSATGNKYSEDGTYTSQIYESPEPISQISLFANHSYNGGNITYSIKPDGANSTNIQPMEEQYADSNIPKILYINSSTTEEDRRNGKWGDGAYIDTGTPMTRFQVVINIERGASENVTPVIDGYVVKVKFADKGGDINAS
jgi:hypothetical protein